MVYQSVFFLLYLYDSYPEAQQKPPLLMFVQEKKILRRKDIQFRLYLI